METETVRLNITLPKGLVQAMKRMTGQRKRSRFIAEAIRDKIEQTEKKRIESLLEEGYRASAKESIALAGEFEKADLEGWDEY
jgi:metal-responsive CopG/Arc/MetJ family transcriptional regulator